MQGVSTLCCSIPILGLSILRLNADLNCLRAGSGHLYDYASQGITCCEPRFDLNAHPYTCAVMRTPSCCLALNPMAGLVWLICISQTDTLCMQIPVPVSVSVSILTLAPDLAIPRRPFIAQLVHRWVPGGVLHR